MTAELTEIYSDAYAAYEKGLNDRAADLFTYLILQDPSQGSFWQGLASVRQVQGYYTDAAMAWGMASRFISADPAPYFHAAQCYICLSQKEEAVKHLDLALQQPCTENLIQKIETMKEVIAHG